MVLILHVACSLGTGCDVAVLSTIPKVMDPVTMKMLRVTLVGPDAKKQVITSPVSSNSTATVPLTALILQNSGATR